MLKFKLKEVKSGPILHYPECLAAGWGMLSAAVTIGDARATRQPDPPPPRRRQCSLQACRVQVGSAPRRGVGVGPGCV